MKHIALHVIFLSLCLFASPAFAEIKRTASGTPDLTGTYNVSTLTPMQRPEQFGNNLELTPEEAEKIMKAEEAAKAALEEDMEDD